MDDNGIIPIESSDTEEDNIPLASRRKVVTVASGSKPRRSIYPAPVVASTFTSVVGSSTSAATTSGTTSSSTKGKGKGRASIIDALDAEDLAFEKRQRDKADEKGKLAKLDEEIRSIDDQIITLQVLSRSLKAERQALVTSSRSSNVIDGDSLGSTSAQRTSNGGSGIDYTLSDYEFSGPMKKKMKRVFGIDDYRLCQEGVCNANMDSRDIICIMPTGGGKSLTYQLPALLTPGTTVVVSPLLSLIADQIMHLHENDIPSVMLTGSVSKAEQREIFGRLIDGPMAGAQDGSGFFAGEDGREIKLLYVTPEKIVKAKNFTAMLQKLDAKGRLARLVIDEAHCVSQLGHDFRPDYKKLSILRKLFPRVPILAVTATCSRKVLPDLLNILGMQSITPSTNANADGTVFFDAPLYRRNLHYKVLTKSSSAKTALTEIADYIMAHHSGQSGIVYCLSKKDTETVAAGLRESSKGKIKTGVYHADIDDERKTSLHRCWRQGKVNVVVATIAFGLGIDKGDVRFVIHHSLSKSLDGYYQETGRAGRDGKDASCVLFYRAQDASRLTALTAGDVEGLPKIHDMLRFAQDIRTCRKILFGRYFSTSASLPSKSWSEKETPCGHCDNCTREPSSVETRNVTLEAWKICTAASAIDREGGRMTVPALADLVRGLGGGSFALVGNGKGKRKKNPTGEKGQLELDDICGGKVSLSKDHAESLIIDLLISGYLEESFSQTAYAVNVYVKVGPLAARLTRLPQVDIAAGREATAVEASFLVKAKAKRTSSATKKAGDSKAAGKDEDGDVAEDEEYEYDEEDAIEEDFGDSEATYVQGVGPCEDDDDEGLPLSKKLRGGPSKQVSASSSHRTPQRKLFEASDDEDGWDAIRVAKQESLWDQVVQPSLIKRGGASNGSGDMAGGWGRSTLAASSSNSSMVKMPRPTMDDSSDGDLEILD